MAGSVRDASSSQGLLGATGLAAAGASGLLSGYAYQHFGRATLFTGAAVVMTVFLLLALFFVRAELRPVA